MPFVLTTKNPSERLVEATERLRWPERLGVEYGKGPIRGGEKIKRAAEAA
jgi:hypothetical protein